MMKVVRCVVVVAILVGCFYSLSADSKLRGLKRDNQDLRGRTGDLRVGDPRRVHIAALPGDTLSAGVDEGIVRLWKFRVYYPSGYQPNYFLRSGKVSANSPRANGSGSSSHNSTPFQEPKFDTLVLAVTGSEHDWRLSRSSDVGSGETSIAPALDLADAESLVFQPVVRPGEGTVSLPATKPICLLRAREKAPVTQHREPAGGEPLYRGFFYYLVPSDARRTFEAQMRGDDDS